MHCLQNFLESAYSLSMPTTKIILIISSSPKMLFLEDILLKCLPKKNKILIKLNHRIFLNIGYTIFGSYRYLLIINLYKNAILMHLHNWGQA